MIGDRTAVTLRRAVAAGYVDPELYDPHNADWEMHLQLGLLETRRQLLHQASLVQLIAAAAHMIRVPADGLKQAVESVDAIEKEALIALMPWLEAKLNTKVNPQAASEEYHAAFGKPGTPEYEAAKRESIRIQTMLDAMSPDAYNAYLDEDLRKSREAAARRRIAEQRKAYIAGQPVGDAT